MSANEWDQRSYENAQEYAWFLGYLALGPARTVSAYVTAHRSMVAKGDKRGQNKRARNRHIEEASMNHHWKKRAGAYDLALLRSELQTSGALVVAAIREYAMLYLTILKNTTVRPKTWDEILSGVQVLAQLFPPETIAVLLQSVPKEQNSSDAVTVS